MNTYKKVITLSQTYGVEKLYLVRVSVSGNTIFNGKIFVMPYQSQVTFDFTDIFANLMYNGAGILKPTFKTSNQTYAQPTSGTLNLTNTFGTNREIVKLTYTLVVMTEDGNTSVYNTTDSVYLRSNSINAARFNQQTWRFFDSDKPIAHFPTVIYSSSDLRWGNTMTNPSTSTVRLYRQNGSTWNNAVTWASVGQGENALSTYLYGLRGHSGNDLYVQDNTVYRPILHIDKCNAPYYLLWIDGDGALTAQRFTSRSEYTEKITVNTRVSSDDTTYTANQFSEGSWKLKSYNLTDAEYEYYMTMIASPYILLYDSAKDRCSYVRISDKNVARKTFTNNQKKPVYMEINLDEITPKNYVM